MAALTADQRNDYYRIEAERAGIHKSILAALYAVHRSPALIDRETGLGIAPANRISLDQVDTFPKQVHVAATTIRSITNKLIAQGWKAPDLWNRDEDRYSDRFLQAIADGYAPPANDLMAARLESTDAQTLRQTYLDDLAQHDTGDLTRNLEDLDSNLLTFVNHLPRHYNGLSHQRNALLEAVRIWRKLDTSQAAIESLHLPPSHAVTSHVGLDQALFQFIQQAVPHYAGYPHQREALLRLVQLWRELGSREEAIASVQVAPVVESRAEILDSALMAFIQRLPLSYHNKGDQRNAVTEAFRLWQGIDARSAALIALGVNPQIFLSPQPDRNALIDAANQLDRQLIEFIKCIPVSYQETDQQREALIQLVQLWRGLDTRETTMQSLLDDLRQMEQAHRDSADAPPQPQPSPRPPRPDRWTPDNISDYLYTPILPGGSLTWAEATHGGMWLPPNLATIDAIVRIAQLAQQARDRLGRPLRVLDWYWPEDMHPQMRHGPRSRHTIGDAITFYSEGLTGNQIYWALDPWWPGGLGRYHTVFNVIYMDARDYRVRWHH